MADVSYYEDLRIDSRRRIGRTCVAVVEMREAG